jgi:hypothetical protein
MNLTNLSQYSYFPFFIEPQQIDSVEDIQEYTLYACYGDVGVFPDAKIGNRDSSLLYTNMFYDRTLDIFKNALVDLDHRGELSIVGKVIDTWMNDSGFKTEGGNEVAKDRMPWCKMIVNLTKEQRDNIKGVSTQFGVIRKPINQEINGIFCTDEVIGVDETQPVYISILVSIEPRMKASETVINGIIKEEITENEKTLDNYNSVVINETKQDMTEEEIIKIATMVADKLAEKQNQPKTETATNMDDTTKATTENADETISEPNSDMAEIKAILNSIIELLKPKATETTENSDGTEEDKKKEDTTTMNSKNKISFSLNHEEELRKKLGI